MVIVTNLQLQIDELKTSKLGKTEKATDAEATAGTNDTHWMTPAKVKKEIDANLTKSIVNGTTYTLKTRPIIPFMGSPILMNTGFDVCGSTYGRGVRYVTASDYVTLQVIVGENAIKTYNVSIPNVNSANTRLKVHIMKRNTMVYITYLDASKNSKIIRCSIGSTGSVKTTNISSSLSNTSKSIREVLELDSGIAIVYAIDTTQNQDANPIIYYLSHNSTSVNNGTTWELSDIYYPAYPESTDSAFRFFSLGDYLFYISTKRSGNTDYIYFQYMSPSAGSIYSKRTITLNGVLTVGSHAVFIYSRQPKGTTSWYILMSDNRPNGDSGTAYKYSLLVISSAMSIAHYDYSKNPIYDKTLVENMYNIRGDVNGNVYYYEGNVLYKVSIVNNFSRQTYNFPDTISPTFPGIIPGDDSGLYFHYKTGVVKNDIQLATGFLRLPNDFSTAMYYEFPASMVSFSGYLAYAQTYVASPVILIKSRYLYSHLGTDCGFVYDTRSRLLYGVS